MDLEMDVRATIPVDSTHVTGAGAPQSTLPAPNSPPSAPPTSVAAFAVMPRPGIAPSSPVEAGQTEAGQTEAGQRHAHWWEPWLAAMGLLAPIVPVPAVVVATVIHYVVEVERVTGSNPTLDNGLTPILGPLLGVLGVLVVWALVAVPWIPHTHRENANPNLWGRLHAWEKQFAPKCGESVHQALLRETGKGSSKIVAFEEAQGAFTAFKEEFQADGNRWARQAGYLTLMRSRHRVEEARIGYAPVEEVAAEAWDARVRLLDSKMDEKTRLELQRTLEISIGMLGPHGRRFLPPDVKKRLDDEKVGVQQASSSKEGSSRDSSSQDQEILARNFVAKAIYDINTYLDDRNDRLLDMRGHLVTAAGWVGGLSYLLILFGTVLLPTSLSDREAWPGLMLGAGVLYLVGAAVGLLYRLYVESRSRFAVEDYGLSMMRIETAPVLSGLAGVLGAVLMAAVLAKPEPLSDVFNLATQPYGLLYAAVFGLTPNVLINYLQRQAKTYIAEIESIKAPAAESTGAQSKD